MTGAVIITELRRGVRTTSELAEATGATRNGVQCAIRVLRQSGHRVTNVRVRGGHGDGLWWLERDAERPQSRVCAAAGCSTITSGSNPTRYCRRHLAELATVLAIERALAGDLEEVEEHEQLVLTR